MSTLQQSIGAVLQECQQPDANAPRLDFVAMKIRDAAQELKHRASNVGFDWESHEVPFDVGPYDDRILMTGIGVADRPSFVLTADQTDPRHTPRRIPIVSPSEVSQYYSGPNQVSGTTHLTQVFSMWREPSGLAYFRPHPNQDANLSFVLWVESGTIPEALGSTVLVGLGGFEAFVKLKASLAVLPACEWSRLLGDQAAQLDPLKRLAVFGAFRSPLIESLGLQLMQWEKAFKQYITNGWEQGAPVSAAYGDWMGY